jgi:hypothetical protein
MNLLPVRWDSGRRSDGARLIDYLRAGPPTPLSYARVRIAGLQIDGVPPRNWDPALAERILSYGRDPAWLSRAALCFLSLGRPANALAALRAAEAARPGIALTAPSLMAFLVAIAERDTPTARSWLAKCGSEDAYDFATWRAAMVILALEGRRDEARAAAAQARKAAAYVAPDADDEMLLSAIEQGRDPPTTFAPAAA